MTASRPPGPPEPLPSSSATGRRATVLVCTQTSRSPQPSAAAAQVAESLARALQRRVWVAARSGVDLAAFDETGEVPFRHGRRRDEKPLPPPLPLRLDEGPPESFLG